MDATIDISIFQKRLAQTIAWCSSRVVVTEPATCLRSLDLRPPGTWIASRLNYKWDEIVTAIAEERERRLHYPGALSIGLAKGRLLICSSITEAIPDGGPTEESLGFIDDDELPPWDTWLCYLEDDTPDSQYRHSYLVSWVPPEFIDLTQAASEVHFLDCLRWADTENTTFTRQLRAAGLLKKK